MKHLSEHNYGILVITEDTVVEYLNGGNITTRGYNLVVKKMNKGSIMAVGGSVVVNKMMDGIISSSMEKSEILIENYYKGRIDSPYNPIRIGKTVDSRKVDKERFPNEGNFNKNNFYIKSFAVFAKVDKPATPADYISLSNCDKASSYYWYGEDELGAYVIRHSDHWSDVECDKIGDCFWFLSESDTDLYQMRAGKAYFKDFCNM